MAQINTLSIGAFLLTTCVLVIVVALEDDYLKYDFIVKPKPQNISCYVCQNYDYDVKGDRRRYRTLHDYCEKDPSKVTFFVQKCTSRNVKGCAVVRTDYSHFSATRKQKRVYHVRRFCTDELLSTCDTTESSRGTIKLCTCTTDFCNAGPTLSATNVAVLIFAAIVTVANLG